MMLTSETPKAKAPGRVADFEGNGEVWFKIYQDEVTEETEPGDWIYHFPNMGPLFPT